MKLFNKLALVAALTVSANAMALQAMDDESLSATTGQDGITLKVFSPGITIDKLLVHDMDGLDSTASINGVVNTTVANPNFNAAAQQAFNAHLAANPGDLAGAQAAADVVHGSAYQVGQPPSITTGSASQAINLGGTDTAGAIVLNDVSIRKAGLDPTKALAVVKIDTDGGNAADGSEATLNIGVDLDATNISVGSIAVGKSNSAMSTTATARRGAVEHANNVILSNLNLGLGATQLNIQLGHQPQGALIVLDGTVQGGLTIAGLTLNDNDGLGGGALHIGGSPAGVAGTLTLGNIHLTSANSTNLTAGLKINVDQNLGLALTLSSAKMDTYIDSINLGNTPSLGQVEIQGLDLGGTTLFVSGH